MFFSTRRVFALSNHSLYQVDMYSHIHMCVYVHIYIHAYIRMALLRVLCMCCLFMYVHIYILHAVILMRWNSLCGSYLMWLLQMKICSELLWILHMYSTCTCILAYVHAYIIIHTYVHTYIHNIMLYEWLCLTNMVGVILKRLVFTGPSRRRSHQCWLDTSHHMLSPQITVM